MGRGDAPQHLGGRLRGLLRGYKGRGPAADAPRDLRPHADHRRRDDPAAPVEKAEIMRSGILDSRLAVIERSAHIANVERPDEVTGEILDHLDPVRKGG